MKSTSRPVRQELFAQSCTKYPTLRKSIQRPGRSWFPARNSDPGKPPPPGACTRGAGKHRPRTHRQPLPAASGYLPALTCCRPPTYPRPAIPIRRHDDTCQTPRSPGNHKPMSDCQTARPDPPTRNLRDSSSVALIWVVLLIDCLWIPLTACGCGHTSWFSSIGSVPLFAFASHVFFTRPRSGWIDKTLGATGYGLIVAALLKNLSDILYFGHEPLLR